MRVVLFCLVIFSSVASADRRTFGQQLERVRTMQDHAELAYRASGVMTNATMDRTIAVVDEAIHILRDVGTDARLNEPERRRLYEEVLRGTRHNTRGSLARVFWSAITHHGADDVERIGQYEAAYKVFRQTFYEVFLDLKSLVTYRRDQHGQKIWTARDRYNRERVARGLTVRFADLLFTIDAAETRSDHALDHVYDAIHVVAQTGVELRRERVVAERGAALFYAGMVFANVFGPMALPFLQFNWVGLVTGGAWGSAPLSGASYVFGYVGLTLAKYFTSTGKTHALLIDLERLAADPGSDTKAKALYQTFRGELLAGRTPLGNHRRKMIERGYRPDYSVMMSCARRLDSAIL